jgi:hypothetical protein
VIRDRSGRQFHGFLRFSGIAKFKCFLWFSSILACWQVCAASGDEPTIYLVLFKNKIIFKRFRPTFSLFVLFFAIYLVILCNFGAFYAF